MSLTAESLTKSECLYCSRFRTEDVFASGGNGLKGCMLWMALNRFPGESREFWISWNWMSGWCEIVTRMVAWCLTNFYFYFVKSWELKLSDHFLLNRLFIAVPSQAAGQILTGRPGSPENTIQLPMVWSQEKMWRGLLLSSLQWGMFCNIFGCY